MDDLIARQCDVVYSFPAYRGMPLEDVQSSARRNVLRAVAVLRGEPEELGELIEIEDDTARRRALQGVPSTEMLVAYRQGFAVIRDAAFAECRRQGFSSDLTVRAASLLWECADQYSVSFLAAQHRVEFDLVRREEQQRVAYLGQLLQGSLTAEEAAVSGARYGMSVTQEYWVTRIRTGGVASQPHSDLTSVLHVPERPVLIASHEGDVVALTRQRPSTLPEGATGGVDGPATLVDLPAAFRRASHALSTAIAFGKAGLYDEARLSARAAVLDQPHLSELFLRRYIETVTAASGMAEPMLDSVDAYLSHRRSFQGAAEVLSVHVNTLRYRLAQYSSITGADLEDVECQIEVWWALRARELRMESERASRPGPKRRGHRRSAP
jgi:hypothetical protein